MRAPTIQGLPHPGLLRTMPALMSPRIRWISVALALIGACSLALAVQGGRWWSMGDAVTIGPGGTTACFDGDCRGVGLEWIGGTELWRRAGIATLAAALIAALTLVALAGSLAARRAGRLAASTALVATLTAAVAGVVFVTTFPDVESMGGPSDAPRLGHGVALYGLGVLIAAAATVVVLRQRAAA